MALDTFIAGRYSGTVNAIDVGITRNGYRLRQRLRAELLDETDAYGNALIDFVWRGGAVSLLFNSKTYKAGAITPFYMWGSLGVLSNAADPIARLASDEALALVLTATANTPAAAAPATLTASKAITGPDFQGELLYDSRIREVPVELQLLPYTSASNLVWFTFT